MNRKPISDIATADIVELISNGVAEGRAVEYKTSLPGSTDADLKEFLADVSSFSNTSGGDLILGVQTVDGVPTEISGIADLTEGTVLRLENMIRDGVEPRIHVETRVVPIDDQRGVVVMRIRRSWLPPHRVTFRGHDKFYARNSGGKYPLDTMELRSAFIASDRLSVQISDFVRGRLSDIAANVTPVPFRSGPKVVLHMIPLESFSPGTVFPVIEMRRDLMHFGPLYATGWDSRINLDGVLLYANDAAGTTYAYTQFYRSGVIEAVSGSLIRTYLKIA
ncbi:MAG: ATP-binding protein [Candidatus Latescibacteria bacterium]|nr:ATP-binding protein [Candidatus Latescibacterota bacterium]